MFDHKVSYTNTDFIIKARAHVCVIYKRAILLDIFWLTTNIHNTTNNPR